MHTKSHGCLRGIFEVRPDLQSDFVTGVFQAGARYPVTARTSNGVPGMQADSSPSTRGFAIKLLEVEGVLEAHQVSASAREWLLPEFAGLQQDFTFLNGKSHVEWLSDDADIKAQKKFANRMEVGRFMFPPQEFDTPEMERMCEAMSYSPWHSIAAHRPLGNMQRARKAVYLAGASLRPSDRSPQKADRIHQEYLKDFSAYGLNRE